MGTIYIGRLLPDTLPDKIFKILSGVLQNFSALNISFYKKRYLLTGLLIGSLIQAMYFCSVF